MLVLCVRLLEVSVSDVLGSMFLAVPLPFGRGLTLEPSTVARHALSSSHPAEPATRAGSRAELRADLAERAFGARPGGRAANRYNCCRKNGHRLLASFRSETRCDPRARSPAVAPGHASP